MALVDSVSFSLRSKDDTVKSLPLYFPHGMTVANIQAGVTAYAPLLDAVTDAVIDSVEVVLALTLPGGLKTQPADGNVNSEGALLTFEAANTNYVHSIFVPAWVEAGFSGKDVLHSGAYAAFIDGIVSGLGTGGALLSPSDRYANDLDAFNAGKRRFRK